MEYFAQAAAHRRRIADLLDTLDADQLATPSLCEGWTVQEVAGHLTSGWNIGMPRFIWGVIKARGDFHAANIKFGKKLGARPAAEIAADLRKNADDTFTPPGIGSEAPLSDAWIHAQDMFVPLGIDYPVDLDDVMPIADLMVDPKSRRVRGNDLDEKYSWRATDTDWSHANDGKPEVTGPMAAIVLALYGRGNCWNVLEGPDGTVI